MNKKIKAVVEFLLAVIGFVYLWISELIRLKYVKLAIAVFVLWPFYFLLAAGAGIYERISGKVKR